MKAIGIDFGSVAFKAVLINCRYEILYSVSRRNEGSPGDNLFLFLDEIAQKFPDDLFVVGTTLTDDRDSPAKKQITFVNEIFAVSTGTLKQHPNAKSIIEIGGEKAKFIAVKSGDNCKVSEFSTNTHCAAGTGSFIEQQAKRLKLNVEKLSELTLKARKGAKIAGRCSVFAKSDMIHLQQKGTPIEEIAYGLCLAIARNAASTLLLGRDLVPPVILAGGVAKNLGILRAFSELFTLEIHKELLPSSIPGLEASYGAAIRALDENSIPLTIRKIKELFSNFFAHPKKIQVLSPLKDTTNNRNNEPERVIMEEVEGYLGIDVGSVSTNLVVVDPAGKLISSVYLPTAGKPVSAIREGFRKLKERFPKGIKILGCGTTGSGRYLAAKIAGADIIKNEITCQMLGTLHYFPDADTIFEIGGQDSKFISLEKGAISDFVMNKICSAGTGSFIEEQSGELGIDIYNEFADLAFRSSDPPLFSSNCTVFMESELLDAMKKGLKKEDACAGLAYSIAQNYLEKVVGKKKIGNKIVFQGGVASNRAVVSAFSQILKKEIHVHPYNRVSGAIGAAIAALLEKPARSNFTGFDIKIDNDVRTFECKACTNYCEVTEIKIKDTRAFFGDVCEKFTSGRTEKTSAELPNLVELYIKEIEKLFKNNYSNGEKIGIPRASFMLLYLPFWWKFFNELGYSPVLSEPTREQTITDGAKSIPAPTCIPVKAAGGHQVELLKKGIPVFFPSITSLPGDKKEKNYVCPFTLSIPFMHKKFPEGFISPQLSMKEDKSFIKSLSNTFHISEERVERSLNIAKEFHSKFYEKFITLGEDLVNNRDFNYKLIVTGRPYNIFDSYLNINLFSHLAKLGILAVPSFFLNLRSNEISRQFVWRFSSDIFKAVNYIFEKDDLYLIILSNFGCGPDAMTFKILEKMLGNKPYLMLEFDEHRGEAGMVTRLEAFKDLLDTREKKKHKVNIYFNLHKADPAMALKEKKIYIPYFADHAYALSGALRFAGLDAEVLPLPDEETRILGKSGSSGKECHAYSMLVGDLLKLINRNSYKEFVYFFTGTNIPCLLNQFRNGMTTLIDEEMRMNISVLTPVMEEFFTLLGVDGCRELYAGLLAIELLFKLRCRIKPYEHEKGRTEQIYQESLKEIEESVAEGETIEGFKRALKRMIEIKRKEHQYPRVGIAGDIYTRINPAANNNLFNYLEEKGIEVIPSPFEIDVIDFDIEREFIHSIERKNIFKAIPAGLLNLKRKRIFKKFFMAFDECNKNLITEYFYEPDYKRVIKNSGPYYFNESNEIIMLNISKIVDFAKKGTDGIINAMCLNCMVGNVSSAIIERIKKDYNDIPIITLTYSDTESHSMRIMLDAFIEQVKGRA